MLSLLLFTFYTAPPVQAIHFPNVWGRREQQQQGQEGTQQQQQGQELPPQKQNTERPAFVNPQEGGGGTCSPDEVIPPPFISSTSPQTIIPTPDSSGALLISLLWEKFHAMIYNHIQMQKRTYERIFSVILYKPPVGMVAIYSILELFLTGRIFQVYDKPPTHGASQAAEAQEEEQGQGRRHQRQRRRRTRRQKGRAYSLEDRDQSYVSYGVIERVRGRLCVSALADLVQEQEASNPYFAAARSALFFQKRRQKSQITTTKHFASPWILATALDALQISCPPGGGSRYDYVDQLREPLAKLRAYQVLQAIDASTEGTSSSTKHPKATHSTELPTTTRPDVLQVATLVLELRATDALLRECRDQLLRTCYRLARAVKYWNRRVEQAKAMAVVQQSLIRQTIEGDRLRLSYVQAALESELERLGRICKVLLMEKKKKQDNHTDTKGEGGRPTEMNDGYLLQALRKSGCEACGRFQSQKETNRQTEPIVLPQGNTAEAKKKWRSTWRLPKLSRYAVRIERGWFKVLRLEKDTFIGGPSAIEVIMEDPNLAEWYSDADSWIRQAKKTLCDVLEETLDASVVERDQQHQQRFSPPAAPAAHDIDWIREAWKFGSTTTPTDDEVEGAAAADLPMIAYNCTKNAWSMAMHVVEDVRAFRRVGEGKNVRFQDLSIVGWLSGFDFFGIPSVLSKIYLAYLLHSWLAPRWPMICAFVIQAWQTIVTIFMTRFWEPGKDVIMDILNRGKSSMLDGFNLQMEEDSLDMMLQEMGYGDGTPATRAKALEAATLQYEEDFRSGLFTNLASGQLVRLLLIQMQQVKVGMLQAVDDIDVLMQANKLNMRVLAIVPAIALVMVAMRTFARHLYNFRSRDLRPINKVHEEMTEHLHRMQSILLLSSEGQRATGDDNTAAEGERPAKLGSAGLGEFAVRMHCYLVLLDYCSPRPFPKKQCDSLHRSLREVLGSIDIQPSEQQRVDQPSMATSVALLELVIKKNRNLQKFL